MTICSVCSLPAGILRLPWLRFFRAFSSVVRQMPGYTSQRRGTVRTLPNSWTVLFYVLFVSIVLFYVLFVCKCVLYYCHRASTQLQLNISYHIISYLSAFTRMESLTRHAKAKNTGQQWSKNMRKSLIINNIISLAHLFISRRRWQKLWRNTLTL